MDYTEMRKLTGELVEIIDKIHTCWDENFNGDDEILCDDYPFRNDLLQVLLDTINWHNSIPVSK